MLKLAFKNLMRRKTRTFLAMLGLILGVMTIISLISITEGVREKVSDVVSEIKGIVITEKDVAVSFLSRLDESDADKIKSITGVTVVCPRIVGSLVLLERGEEKTSMSIPTRIYGVDPMKESLTKKGPLPTGGTVEKGRALLPSDKYAVVIDKDTADDQKKTVGSKIEIGGKKFKVVGITEPVGGAGRSIIMPLDEAREVLNIKEGKVTGFYVEINDPSQDKLIAKKIEAKLGNVEARTTEEFASQFLGMLSNVDSFLWIVSIIAVVVGALGIINTMLMSVRERTKEFGVLKAVGWTSEDVLKLVMIESFLVGVGGAIFGIILGMAVVEVAKPLLGLPLAVTPGLVFKATLFAIVVGVIGGIYPAWEASKLDPIQAISKE